MTTILFPICFFFYHLDQKDIYLYKHIGKQTQDMFSNKCNKCGK